MIEVEVHMVGLGWDQLVEMDLEIMMVGMVEGTGAAEGGMVDMEEVGEWVVLEVLAGVVVVEWELLEEWEMHQEDLGEEEEGLEVELLEDLAGVV